MLMHDVWSLTQPHSHSLSPCRDINGRSTDINGVRRGEGDGRHALMAASGHSVGTVFLLPHHHSSCSSLRERREKREREREIDWPPRANTRQKQGGLVGEVEVNIFPILYFTFQFCNCIFLQSNGYFKGIIQFIPL
ncbi:hypothetical protein GUJ93_ZPchr0002g24380 [Zizania palustris]|uniref:Uncharacterized protein n=1 Tax=Zizania palustris TaxID=103762 RepID=A0A8J5S1Z8_ZIZPA|nr:hypothetical protein GUJ93_ZPchr0002g24380 [Zizania palustris]